MNVTGVGEIPEEWEVVRISDIATRFLSGGTPLTSNSTYWNGNIPWMRSASISGRLVIAGEKYISEDGLKNSATNIVPKNNLLIATRVSIGNAAINKLDIAISQDLTGVVIDRKKVNVEYLYWTIGLLENRIRSVVQGSTIKGILREDLENLKIPLAPLPEQLKIASILSTVDDDIVKVDEIITKTQRLKKGLMQQLLTKGIGHTNFKKTKIGEIPQIWDTPSLKQIVSSYKNGIYKRPEFYGRGPPSIRMYNIQDGEVNMRNAVLLDVSEEELEQYGLVPGDILVNRVNSLDLVGKAGFVPEGMGPVTFESKNIRVRVRKEICDSRFLAYFMNSESWYKQIRASVKSAISQATINQEDLNRMLVPLPPLEEQQQICHVITGIDSLINSEQLRRASLDKLRKGLMKVLLSGKVRVKVN